MRTLPDAPAGGLTTQPPRPGQGCDPAEYRRALSCFGTGVTVVSTHAQGQDWGMTCNSFASVSLEPRLVLWSIRRQASSLEAFTRAEGFAVSVLAEDQAALARQFASGDRASRFAGVDVQRLPSQRLYLCQAVAWFDCRLHQVVEAGDHLIVIGQVEDFAWREGPALSFWRSQLGGFAPTA